MFNILQRNKKITIDKYKGVCPTIYFKLKLLSYENNFNHVQILLLVIFTMNSCSSDSSEEANVTAKNEIV
jgi:hypothetical protein